MADLDIRTEIDFQSLLNVSFQFSSLQNVLQIIVGTLRVHEDRFDSMKSELNKSLSESMTQKDGHGEIERLKARIEEQDRQIADLRSNMLDSVGSATALADEDEPALKQQVKKLHKTVITTHNEMKARTDKLHTTDMEVAHDIAHLRGVLVERVALIENSLNYLKDRIDHPERGQSVCDSEVMEAPHLVFFGEEGQERLGVLDHSGVLRDLSQSVAHGFEMTPQSVKELAQSIRVEDLPVVEGKQRVLGVRFDVSSEPSRRVYKDNDRWVGTESVTFARDTQFPTGSVMKEGSTKWRRRSTADFSADVKEPSGRVFKEGNERWVGVRFAPGTPERTRDSPAATIWKSGVGFADELGEPNGKVLKAANEKWRRRSVDFSATTVDPSGGVIRRANESWRKSMDADTDEPTSGNFVSAGIEHPTGAGRNHNRSHAKTVKDADEKKPRLEGYWDNVLDEDEALLQSFTLSRPQDDADAESGSNRTSASGLRAVEPAFSNNVQAEASERRRSIAHGPTVTTDQLNPLRSTVEALAETVKQLEQKCQRDNDGAVAALRTANERITEADALLNKHQSSTSNRFLIMQEQSNSFVAIMQKLLVLFGLSQHQTNEVKVALMSLHQPNSGTPSGDGSGSPTNASEGGARVGSDAANSSSIGFWLKQLPHVQRTVEEDQQALSALAQQLAAMKRTLEAQKGSGSGSVLGSPTSAGHSVAPPTGPPSGTARQRNNRNRSTDSAGSNAEAIDFASSSGGEVAEGEDNRINVSGGGQGAPSSAAAVDHLRNEVQLVRTLFDQNNIKRAHATSFRTNTTRLLQQQMQHLEQQAKFTVREVQDLLQHGTTLQNQLKDDISSDLMKFPSASFRGASSVSSDANVNTTETPNVSTIFNAVNVGMGFAAEGLLRSTIARLGDELQYVLQCLPSKVDLTEFKHRVERLEQWVAKKADRTDLNMLLEQPTPQKNSHHHPRASIVHRPTGSGTARKSSSAVDPASGVPPLDHNSDMYHVIDVVNAHAALLHTLSGWAHHGDIVNDLSRLKERLDLVEQLKADAEVVARKAEHGFVEGALDSLQRELGDKFNVSNTAIMDTLDSSLNLLKQMLDGKANAMDVQNLKKTLRETAAQQQHGNTADGLAGYRCLSCNKVMEGMRLRPNGMMWPNFTNHNMSPAKLQKQLFSLRALQSLPGAQQSKATLPQQLQNEEATIQSVGSSPRLPPIPPGGARDVDPPNPTRAAIQQRSADGA